MKMKSTKYLPVLPSLYQGLRNNCANSVMEFCWTDLVSFIYSAGWDQFLIPGSIYGSLTKVVFLASFVRGIGFFFINLVLDVDKPTVLEMQKSSYFVKL